MPRSPAQSTFDAVVIGDGIIGLSAALELARSGASCALVGASEPGGGSGAAAGILAPSVGNRDAEVRNFFRYSLDLFPAFLAPLRAFDHDLAVLQGLLEILPAPSGAARQDGSQMLSAAEVRQTEPEVSAPYGAVLHTRDGAVDNTRILAALRLAVSGHPSITVVMGDAVTRVDLAASPARVGTRGGVEIRGRFIVLAAGAWSPQIDGLPRPLPVYPLKGQMIALDAPSMIRHPTTNGHVYLVPRGSELYVGATSERAGFDTTTHDDAEHALRASAIDICPALAGMRVTRRWAGLRPATADLMPIIGPDPKSPSLIYACGHSRNGILLSPATAVAVRAFVEGTPAAPHIERFTIGRFSD